MWWCVKSLNWSHLRHTRCSPVFSRHAGHLPIHVCQSWEMGTPVIWAPKKMSHKAAPLIPKHLWFLDPKLLKALAERVVRWRSACCLAKVFNSIFQNRTEDIQQELVDKIGRAISFGEVLWFHGEETRFNSSRAAPHSSMRGCQCICHFCTYFSQSVFTRHQSAHKRERFCARWTHSQIFQCWMWRQILCSLMFALELSFNLFSLGSLVRFLV